MGSENINGVDSVSSNPATLKTYTDAAQKLSGFSVPELYDSSDPNCRVFVALFDGTCNSYYPDEKDAFKNTNIGKLKEYFEQNITNPVIEMGYEEGVGTQTGIARVYDAATGYTYDEKVEDMYDQFARQVKIWLAENPNAKISVVSLGFSRGAVEAAVFSKIVDQRGIYDPDTIDKEKVVVGPTATEDGYIKTEITFSAPPIVQPGNIAQALGLFDPVETGWTSQADKQPASSVISGIQITALDELRTVFPVTSIIDNGLSQDGRFLGMPVTGAHCDIGGSYKLDGLSTLSYNLMATYLDALLGNENIVPTLDTPSEPEKYVIHNSVEHSWIYKRADSRQTTYPLNSSGATDAQPVNQILAAKYLYNTIGQYAEPNDILNLDETVGSKISKIFDFDDIWVGEGGNDILNGGNSADLINGGVGDDLLDGGDDNDWLIGGDGEDELAGGKGNDILIGGKGTDTYIYNVGDGNDIIVDEDGMGEIRIERNGNAILAGTFYRSNANNVWTDPTGKIQLVHNNTWQIVLEDGGSIDLGENFQDGDFGIHLVELPTITTTSTIVGDLTPIPADPGDYQYDALGYAIANAKTDALGNAICDLNAPAPNRNDFLYDSAGNDRIQAGGGDDIICANKGGNDILEGGSGADIVADYGDGNNQLYGDNYGGMSTLVNTGEVAESINEKGDLLSAEGGTDQLYGSNRNDALFGGGGNDLLIGGGGNDIIMADSSITSALHDWSVSNSSFSNLWYQEAAIGGADNIYGGSGIDTVYAGGGDDNIDGGSGDDNLYGESGNDSITGGDGNDFIQGDADWQAADTHGNDYIDGGSGNDIIMGLGGNDDLFGGDGNDEILGGDGDDHLDGEAGDDRLWGGAGNDELFGGDGNDYLDDTAGENYLDGEAGNDKIWGGRDADQIMGGDGDDELHGEAGDDYIDGEAGNDIILGGDGNDQLFGGDGNDHLQGDAGSDYLDGEAGNDVLMGLDGNDQIMGGDGDDELQGNAGDDILDGGTGNDVLDGGAGNDTISGGEGNDWLQGVTGNDTLEGGDGNDTLLGGAGDDKLYGGDGNDTLQGDEGHNILVGGAGDDTYIIDPSKGTNQIIDNFDGTERNVINTIGATTNINSSNTTISNKNGGINITVHNNTNTNSGNTNVAGIIKLFSYSFGGFSVTKYDVTNYHGPLNLDVLMMLGNNQQMTFNELIAGCMSENEMNYMQAGAIAPIPRRDPLIMDLDGDGIETTRINTSTYFDYDANGFAERTAWVGKDDGMLVMDKNGDGIINNGRELFGDQTVLKNGRLASNGFEALADLDVNKDGVIDAADTGFDQLRVWRDANGDAISTSDELHDLYSLGIKEIRLVSQVVNTSDGKGNTVVRTGSFILADNTERTIAEYQLERNVTHTVATDVATVSDDIALLPDLAGSGKVMDLRQALQKEQQAGGNALKTLIDQFVAATDSTARNNLIDRILSVWSGTDSVVEGSRGVLFSARKLAVIEAFMGKPFFGQSGASPNDLAAIILEGIYEKIQETNYALLMEQTHLKDIYAQVTWVWEAGNQLTADLTQVAASMLNVMENNVDAGKQLLSEFARTWRVGNSKDTLSYLNFREKFVNADPELGCVIDSGGLPVSNKLVGTSNAEAIMGTPAFYNSISSGDGNDVVYGPSHSSYIFNNSGDAVLVGGLGDDSIGAGAGDDIIDGGAGNDNLGGGIGNDTYIFRKGSGKDRIDDFDNTPNNSDTVYMGNFILPDEVVIKRNDYDLELNISGTNDTLTIANWFYNEVYRVERVLFSDGTIWNADTIRNLVLKGTEGDQTLVGYETDDLISGNGGNDNLFGQDGNDKIEGGNGDDYLSGGNGNDVLDGGAGNDVLDGGYLTVDWSNQVNSNGNDTYIFGRGYGNDIISDFDKTSGNLDTISFASDISPSDVTLGVAGEDLFLTIKDTSDRLQISKWFAGPEFRVEEIRFADGTIWDASYVMKTVTTPTPTNDYLVGTPGNDVIDGGDGNDWIYGRSGDDIIYGGNSVDYLYGEAGSDTLYGGSGNDSLYDNDGNNSMFGDVGEDTLNAEGGSNTLAGGADNDQLNISGGTNTISYNRGDGFDKVNTYLSSTYIDGDKVLFGEGITPESLSIQISDGNANSGGYGGDIPRAMAYIVDGGDSGGYGGTVNGPLKLAIGIGNNEGMLIEGIPASSGYGGGYGGDYGGGYGGGYGETFDLSDISIRRFIFADGRELTLEELIGMADRGVIGEQQGSYYDETLLGSVADDSIYGQGGNDRIDGRDNNDYLDGGDGNDALSAGNGTDYVLGRYGDDVIAGGKGDDYLDGGNGNDVYAFNRGDGHDVIGNYPGVANGDKDTISFGVGVLPEDIRAAVNLSSGELILSIAGAEDSVTILWFNRVNGTYVSGENYVIPRMQFIDAAGNARVFDLASLIDARKSELIATTPSAPILLFNNETSSFELTGTEAFAGGDYAVAYAQTGDMFAVPTYVTGTWRNDNLKGNAGDDTLEGFSGDDKLAGGAGNDTYIYNLWDGNDTIDDNISTLSEPNSILFGYGISPDDITLSHELSLGQLVLNIAATGEKICINHFLASDPYGPHTIEYFKFDDGQVLTWHQMIDKGFDIIGTSADDVLAGTATTDRITGDVGNDTIIAGRGDDLLIGGGGDDLYRFNIGDGVDTIDDLASPGEGNRIQFGEGIKLADITQRLTYRDNTLIIRVGPAGDEIHLLNFNPNEAATGTSAVQSFQFSDGTLLNYEDLVKNTFIIQGDTGDDVLKGTNLTDRLYGYEGSDNLQGGIGNDTLTGGIGNDVLEGGAGLDAYVFNLGDGVDTIRDISSPEEGNLIVFGEGITKDDIRTRIDGDKLVIEYGDNGDAIHLLNYDYSGSNATHVVEQIEFSDGSRIQLSSLVDPGTEGADHIVGTQFDDVIDAKGGDDDIDGLSGNDRLYGGTGNDELYGNAGDDTIVGGQGMDHMDGGEGFDTYVFNLGDGSDVILDAPENGVGNIIAFGDGISQSNVSMAADGSDLILNYGGAGDSIRVVDFYLGGQTNGLPISSIQFADGTSYNLVELVNKAPISGGAAINSVAAEDNDFISQVPDDAFVDPEGLPMTYRATGADNGVLPGWLSFNPITRTFSGIPGNADVGDHTVVVTAYDNFGAKTSRTFAIEVKNTNDAPVVSSVIADQATNEDQLFSFQISAGSFTDIDAGDSLTYSATLANGEALPAWLVFDATTQTFSGTPGNDEVGLLGIKVTATDLSGTSVSGNFNINIANVNDAPVVVTALIDQADTEDQAFSFQIPTGSFKDIDQGDSLTYAATLADGSALPNWLTFDAATQTLSGIPANENVGSLNIKVTATDLAGTSASSNFNLNVANINDAPILVTPLTDQATNEDQLFSYQVPADAFNDIDNGDTLTYSATLADGSALPRWLVFDSATRTFSGTAASGSAGVMNLVVTATDQSGVSISDTFSLTINATDLPIYGTPNADEISALPKGSTIYGLAGDDILYGDIGKDKLYGGDGEDNIYGWYGNDLIDGGNGRDILTGDWGNDTIHGGAGLDNLYGGEGDDILYGEEDHDYLEGNQGNDILYGGAGCDELLGGEGADTMIGGAGHDLYVVDNIGDTVIELAGEGCDTVNSSINYILGDNLEQMLLTGTEAINGTGNELDNYMTGNSASNILSSGAGQDIIYGKGGDDIIDGGADNDSMYGGAGNDTYFVDNINDVVQESSGQGTDTVNSSVSYTLTSNVENLTLIGTDAINGTGNSLANTLIGNASNNILDAKAGNDILNGGAGTDTLKGGTGNDTYILGRSYGNDTIIENDSTVGNTDIAQFGSGITTEQLWFQHVGNNLEVSVIGSSDKFTIQNWYSGSAYHVEQFKTSDGKVLMDTQVDALVSAMATFTAPAAGQTTLPDSYRTTLAPVIAANWQ